VAAGVYSIVFAWSPAQYTAHWYPTQGPDHPAPPVVNVNGAGDSLVGAMCAGLAQGLPAVDALAQGMMAARLSVQVCIGRQSMACQQLCPWLVWFVQRHCPCLVC
jgi:sugar/nucleoside kinase (ribokinase family)